MVAGSRGSGRRRLYWPERRGQPASGHVTALNHHSHGWYHSPPPPPDPETGGTFLGTWVRHPQGNSPMPAFWQYYCCSPRISLGTFWGESDVKRSYLLRGNSLEIHRVLHALTARSDLPRSTHSPGSRLHRPGSSTSVACFGDFLHVICRTQRPESLTTTFERIIESLCYGARVYKVQLRSGY